jgi:HTH-type transcriptional regulator / antitoxin HigA
MTTQYDPKAYNKLLISVSPGAIESEDDYERILSLIDQLMRKDEDALSPEEDRLLRLLAVLVEDYESHHYPMDSPANPSVALRELMREHELKQADMVEIFGSQGTVSQVLNGKREISKAQARKLSKRFRLPIDVFI